jgi:hypothetical protein
MSYIGMGDTLDTVNTIVSGVDTIGYIVEDPALPKIIGYIKTLHDLEQAPTGAAAVVANHAGGGYTRGIGLNRLVMPLQAYVQIRKNPILGYLLIGAILSLPFMLGYMYRGKKR